VGAEDEKLEDEDDDAAMLEEDDELDEEEDVEDEAGCLGPVEGVREARGVILSGGMRIL